jgi:hypothetical protein
MRAINMRSEEDLSGSMLRKNRQRPIFGQATIKGFVSVIGGKEACHMKCVQVGIQVISDHKLRGTEYELYHGRTNFKYQTFNLL